METGSSLIPNERSQIRGALRLSLELRKNIKLYEKIQYDQPNLI